MKKPLKYSEYKLKQGLWIQRDYEDRFVRAENLEQFCIKSYLEYLEIIGVYNENISTKAMELYNSIKFYNIIKDNINTLMDSIDLNE